MWKSSEQTKKIDKKLITAIDERVSKIIDNAPEELDTLKELGAAFKQNKDGISAINTALSERYTKGEVDSLLTSTKSDLTQKITENREKLNAVDNEVQALKANAGSSSSAVLKAPLCPLFLHDTIIPAHTQILKN